ncbi:MAG TPA: tripartite tricarboxylate transporter substrate binding protein [Pseudolabrys sp.]|nr:tripartite tricarboxylate transporter substrate binding protein [Pseudolabrys sp.]
MSKVVSGAICAMRRAVLLVLPALLIAALAPLGQAQAKWPEKPVKIILPFGAGGVADVSSRILADKLDKKFGQRVVIENMPGPGGINAARAVVNAPPDGYTLGLVTNGTAISVAAFKHLPFDPVKQFAMISELGQFNLLFAVDANSKYKTLKDFIQDAKANPGKLNIGTVVVGSTQNLGAELFRSKAGIKVTLVPFRRSPDAVVALLRNDIQMLVEFPPAIAGQVASHKLRVLASTGEKREASMPDVPTVEQEGIKDYVVSSWNGVFAPQGTPQEVIDTMGKAMREVLAQKDVQERFAKIGVEAHSSTPAELMAKLKDDIKKWSAVIEKAGIPKK